MDALADDVGVIVPTLLVLVGLIGIVVPVLPGLLLVLGGVLLWAGMDGSATAWTIFAISVLLAAAGFALQYLVPGRRMRQAGVSNSTLVLAVVIAIIGFFVIPVVGAIIGFVLGIYVVELGRSKDRSHAWVRTKHALIAVLQSVGIELLAGLGIAGVYVVGLTVT